MTKLEPVKKFKPDGKYVDENGIVVMPQIIMIVDDLGAEKVFSNPKGEMYKLMINQRHCGL